MNMEFGLSAVGPCHCLSGRVFAGSVHAETRFAKGYQILYATPDVVPLRISVVDIDLTVVRIECYGRIVNQLDEGLTGALVVEGRGIEFLSAGMSIGAESAPDSPSPVA